MGRETMVKVGIAFVLGLAWMGCSPSGTKDRLSQDLIKASRRGDATSVDHLIRAGADINAVDAEGWTPYLAAAVEGNWKVMKMLQERGCKTDPGF
jgi:ankyrin repeat protein